MDTKPQTTLEGIISLPCHFHGLVNRCMGAYIMITSASEAKRKARQGPDFCQANLLSTELNQKPLPNNNEQEPVQGDWKLE